MSEMPGYVPDEEKEGESGGQFSVGSIDDMKKRVQESEQWRQDHPSFVERNEGAIKQSEDSHEKRIQEIALNQAGYERTPSDDGSVDPSEASEGNRAA